MPASHPLPPASPGLWKDNWPQTRQHYLDWWDRRGLVVGAWGTGLPTDGVNHDPDATEPPAPGDFSARQTDAEFIAVNTRYKMARRTWPADILPAAWPHTGTLPLAAYLGAEPEYSPSAIWYHACMDDLDTHPPLRFDPDHPRVRELEAIVTRTVEQADGRYLVGLPALLPGIDVLAELRGAGTLMMDLLESPDAVHERLDEIYEAWTIAYDRLASVVHRGDDGMAFGYFMLWDQGRCGLAQCDSAAMFSPDLFAQFVVPTLRKQCAHLDRCMYHVDGAQALRHLDLLLAIEDLDAIEFTPDPKSPGGGDEQWYPLYRQILEAGKSVWVANLRKPEVLPLLDAIGGRGVFVSVNGLSPSDAEALARDVEPYRR
jgi:hypothetical protein